MGEKLVGSRKLLAASDVVDHPVADVLRTFQLIFDCLHVVMHRIHHLHLELRLFEQTIALLVVRRTRMARIVQQILAGHPFRRCWRRQLLTHLLLFRGRNGYNGGVAGSPFRHFSRGFGGFRGFRGLGSSRQNGNVTDFRVDAFFADLLDGLRLVVDVVAGPGARSQVALDGRAGLGQQSQRGLLQVDL